MPIFDQGYQHWKGTLSGHAWRWLTITRHGVAVGKKNIFLRILVIASWIPAIGLAGVLCAWGLLEQRSSLVAPFMPILSGIFPPEVVADPKQLRVVVWTLSYDWFLSFELYVSMIVVLLVGPALISQDLRFNALPLYFSRPLRRGDYFLGKLGVIAWFLGLVMILPSLIAYALGLLFSMDITILWDTFPLLLACVAYGAVIVLSAGTLILALSSLSRNSRYVALFWVGIWFVSMLVGSILNGVASEQRRMRHYQTQAALQARQVGNRPMNQAEMRAWQDGMRKAEADFHAEQLELARSDWKPMVSYVANLARVGRQLLRTDAAWAEWRRVAPPNPRVMGNIDPQYPWYWSAGLLAGLLGLSAWILNSRIRSLDRLK
jgi:ABC-2 type transport system permease protein